jgi:hypothetical protein
VAINEWAYLVDLAAIRSLSTSQPALLSALETATANVAEVSQLEYTIE